MTILDKAAAAVHGPRQQDYGHPRDNHRRTAILWNSYLFARYGLIQELDREDVCYLNLLQKVARDMHAPGEDNLVDVAGWAANIEMLRGDE